MARRRLWWVGPPIFVGLVILISLDSIQWVFLARVQWVAWFALVILPALAHTLGRELLIGTYDLDNSRAGFHVGFLLVLVGTSIVDTAYITQKYGQERLREALGHVFLPSWGWILLGFVMIALNMGAALVATDPKRRTRILYGLISGFVVGVGAWLLLDFVISRRIPFLLREADMRLSSTFPFISPAARPLPADSLPDGKPVADGPREASAIGRFTMNLHLADGGYYDNSGVAALVQWLHNGLRDLADRDLAKLPKEILVVRINAFPAAEQVYVREHRGAFFQFWAPLLAANTFRAATRACSADRELELLSERWSGEVLGRHNGKHRDGVRIQTVDLTFSASRTYGRKRSPLSWHLRKEERAEIENAWNTIRTGEQAQKVLAYLEPEKSKRLLPMGHHTSRFNIRFGRRIAGWDVSSKPWME
jgi:hypothetical protein